MSMERLRHPSHEHELNSRVISTDCDILRCKACRREVTGKIYCCEDCEFFLHEACADLPQKIWHPLHSDHPLTLAGRSEHRCRICLGQGDFAYVCDCCDVRLDAACVLASLPREDFSRNQVDDAVTLRLFDHEHPFILVSFETEISLSCGFCWKRIIGRVYGCLKCRQFFHMECCELLRQISHFFHPTHPLDLVIEASKSVLDSDTLNRTCNACGSFCESVLYNCQSCKFRLHVPCAATTFPLGDCDEEKGSWVKYFGHEHRLRSFLVKSDNGAVNCRACEHRILGEVYGCPDCKYFVHKSCTEMPPEIQHDLHPQHPLSIVIDPSQKAQCPCCWSKRNGFSYQCVQCNFDLHFGCVVNTLRYADEGLPTAVLDPLSKQYRTLGHVIRNLNILPRRCDACQEFLDGPAYFCLYDRKISKIHLSCLDLPLTAEHPFHHHPVALRFGAATGDSNFQCNACRGYSQGLAMSCGECQFHLDIPCFRRATSLKHPLHEHKLAYFKKAHGLQCNSCRKSCSFDLYRCVMCNFNLHRDCLPLPRKAKDRRHLHVLTLYDRVLEDDSGEYYCDLCETRRNPDLGAYYCAECRLIAHIECALSALNLDLKFSDDLSIAEINKKIVSLKERLAAAESKREDVKGRLKAAKMKRAALCS